MNLRLSPQAIGDINNALEYYRTVSDLAGETFVAHLDQAFHLLIAHPAIAPQVYFGIRRFAMRQFPYGIYYAVDESDGLLVLSILHLKRDPTTIDERIKP